MTFRKIIAAIPARRAEPAHRGVPAHHCGGTVTTTPARARRVVTVERAHRRVIGG